MVKLLLKAGANPSAPNRLGESAIEAAERNGFDDIFKLLKDSAATIRESNTTWTAMLELRGTTMNHLDDTKREADDGVNVVSSSI